MAFDHVTKRYGDAPPAVDDLSLTINAGEICVLVGPSGCGKTTTMKMINRLIEPTGGRITIDGEDVAGLPAVELRRRIGYVIQQVGLFPHMTVADNVAIVPRLLRWPAPRIKARVDELLELVGLDPGAYAGRYPAALSGGERQRIGVARALAADPPVMLMDEPFGAVDPIRRERLQNEFLRLQAQVRKTVVFVTHDVDEAIKMADRIAILQRGGILAQYDTPDAILANPASEFVEHFVGADRGLKRRGRVRDLTSSSRSSSASAKPEGGPGADGRAAWTGTGWWSTTPIGRSAGSTRTTSRRISQWPRRWPRRARRRAAGDDPARRPVGDAAVQRAAGSRGRWPRQGAGRDQRGRHQRRPTRSAGGQHRRWGIRPACGGIGPVREGQPFFRVDWVIENADVLARRIGEQLVITGIAIGRFRALVRGRAAGPALSAPVRPGAGRHRLFYLDPQHRPVRAADPDHRAVAADRRDRAGRLRDGHPGAQHRDRAALGAARGAGGGRRWATTSQRLWRVEVPIAVPIIVAGLRIATVTIRPGRSPR